MWCRTYPINTSSIVSSGGDVQEHLNAYKDELIGPPILKKFGTDLPYLPKVPFSLRRVDLPSAHKSDPLDRHGHPFTDLPRQRSCDTLACEKP